MTVRACVCARVCVTCHVFRRVGTHCPSVSDLTQEEVIEGGTGTLGPCGPRLGLQILL